MKSNEPEIENRTSIFDEDPQHDYFEEFTSTPVDPRDLEIFDDSFNRTTHVLDPDRLQNLNKCPFCGTINRHNKDTCKKCGKPREWLSMHQFSGE
jgi:ribosomal protein L32